MNWLVVAVLAWAVLTRAVLQVATLGRVPRITEPLTRIGDVAGFALLLVLVSGAGR